MNCFNGEKYLKEALDSVLLQEYDNWELIFWDNQSTDKSADILKSYSNPRFKYFYSNEHTKLYEARNYAISKSSGDLIAFLDTDDYWTSDKLSVQVPLFDDESVGMVFSNYTILDQIDNVRYLSKCKLHRGYISSYLLKEYFIGLLTLIIRKKSYDGIAEKFDPNLQIIGDLDLTVRLADSWRADFSTQNLGVCRKHGENLLIKESKKNIYELLYWEKKIQNYQNIASSEGFLYFKQNSIYLNLKQNVKEKNTFLAIRNLFSIKKPKLFLKGLILISIPSRFIIFLNYVFSSKIK
jgi:glycosyltransferase involved in cell wall biosynthesis